MCIHETIQLAQDGSRLVMCGDCGREFGQIGLDESESFIAFTSKDHPVLVAVLNVYGAASKALAVTTTGNGNYATTTVQACGECGFLGSCEDFCHS